MASLACRPGGRWVDATVGAGGHAEEILRLTTPDGWLLGCDRDADALAAAGRRLRPYAGRVVLRHTDFRRIPSILDGLGAVPVDGILVDLGVSSLQLDDPERGFSFRRDGPLDMRMDRSAPTTAADLVNSLLEGEIASILSRYGEEPAARRIARAIGRERRRAPITSTGRLASIVSRAAGRRRPRIHPATRAFQALRVAVNDEITGLDRFLEESAWRLRAGGRIVVISFHSLEDRIVKRTLQSLADRCLCPRDLPLCGCGRPNLVRVLSRRAARPAPRETAANPRARSARLRAAERLAGATR